MTPPGDDAKSFVLESADPAALGLNPAMLERLCRLVQSHIDEGRYPGAQIAVARHGKLGLFKTFGSAKLTPQPAAARDDSLWLLYSNTKVIIACAIWMLVEEGTLTFTDKIADHIPEFAKHGKGEITLFQLLTHQGGFPAAGMDRPRGTWTTPGLREWVSNFTLEWTPGSRVEYHRLAAHWVCAVLIEAITEGDFRDFIRGRIIEPLGLGKELFVGMPESELPRAADMHTSPGDGTHAALGPENSAEFRRLGVPGSGGFATARAMAAFYQALANGGALHGTRLVSPRLMQYVTRDFTGDRIDHFMGAPMHRGLGPQTRGDMPETKGPGTLGSPRTFGHGGVESSFCWGDPDSGVSFAYITNGRAPNPWHGRRLDIVSNLAHAAIEDLG